MVIKLIIPKKYSVKKIRNLKAQTIGPCIRKKTETYWTLDFQPVCIYESSNYVTNVCVLWFKKMFYQSNPRWNRFDPKFSCHFRIRACASALSSNSGGSRSGSCCRSWRGRSLWSRDRSSKSLFWKKSKNTICVISYSKDKYYAMTKELLT